MRLLMIHGRAQEGKDQHQLKKTWTESLDVGLANAHLGSINQHEKVFPYYGDELARLVAELKLPADGGATAKGLDSPNLPEQLQIDLLQELLANGNVTVPEGDDVVEKGARNWRWVHALLRAADATPAGPWLINAVTEDVVAYLTKSAVSRRIDAIITEELQKGPCVMVAHSLGSIIAYRALRSLGERAQCKQLITVGSPLGLQAVRDMLVPRPLQHPDNVSAWFNAFDPRDVVSLRPLDESTWDVKPRIENFAGVENHIKNCHDINGYLDNAVVAGKIFTALNAGYASI